VVLQRIFEVLSKSSTLGVNKGLVYTGAGLTIVDLRGCRGLLFAVRGAREL
jgi:hypothetical protein